MSMIERQNAQPGRSQDSRSWAKVMQGLRADYMRNSAANLDAIGRLIELMEGRPSAEALRFLLARFHGLNGSGLTYGFPEVSLLGARGEEKCRVVLQGGGTASAGDFATWRSLLDGLHRELAPRTTLRH